MSEPTFDEVIVNGREYVSKDWHGLMEILDDVYPASVFQGGTDPGPQIVALLRQINDLRS